MRIVRGSGGIWLIAGLIMGLFFVSISAASENTQYEERDSRLESIEKRLEVMEKTMENMTEEIIKWRTQEKCQTIGCNCKFIKECVFVTCCRWGSTGNGGTPKCLEQCCGAWETRFKCD